ncbi:hypothetical protein [Nostoc sp. NMS8]|uniref:hypothetical protein n=1 Tax=Nostoc sp. NMS8 TaxID=2815392 RepID=UPI0025E27A91|nr:hypothetical protein [Nostoc sp. NMS8]MBN3963108.1 hypothetical protein [Nostoc sp. NMS8]
MSSKFFSGIFSIKEEDIGSLKAGMCASQAQSPEYPDLWGNYLNQAAKSGSFGEIEKV